ncbi:MAG TPA: hypothetical protein VNT26_17350 [Candidatus Sulfotelmatobacter sp.]|nr:hypothetical protein [Candidatus Sulfotelmatobacter sp.]
MAPTETQGQEAASRQSGQSLSLSRFLLPPAFQGRLDLTVSQRTRVVSPLRDFVSQNLENELARIMQVLHQRFPNLKLVYLSSRTSSRTYGSFAKTRLNPEPYAFESGFSVKWLLERQLKGEAALNCDPAKGAVTAP